MKTTVSYKTIWSIAYPIIMGSLAQTLIMITDTAFLGRVSEVALGAAAMAGIYYYVFSTFAWGFSIGIQIIIARRFGEKRDSHIGKIFEHGMWFVLPLALLLFLIQHYGSAYLLNASIQSSNIYEAAMVFISYRHYGIIFVCFNFLFRALYIGISSTKVIGYTTILMATVNVLLNYSLIFGKFGLPAMGVGGSALASVIAEGCGLLFFISYTLLKLPLRRYALFQWHRLEGWLMKIILRTAFPTMLQKLLSFGVWYIFFIMVEHMGERPLAISMVVRSVYMLILLPVFGFGATTNTLTSRLIGEGRKAEVHSLVWKVSRFSLFCIIPVLSLCYFFPNLVLSVYSNNPGLVAESIHALYVIGLAAVTFCFGIIWFEAVSGTGNTIHALYAETLVLIPYLLQIWLLSSVFETAIEWVWTGEISYGVLIGSASLLYMKYYRWQKNKL